MLGSVQPVYKWYSKKSLISHTTRSDTFVRSATSFGPADFANLCEFCQSARFVSWCSRLDGVTGIILGQLSLFIHKNVFCDPSLEPSQRMFLLRNMKAHL